VKVRLEQCILNERRDLCALSPFPGSCLFG